MLQRSAWSRFDAWREGPKGLGLLVTGARQVGKTFLIREFGRTNYEHVAEVNLVENRRAASLIDAAQDASDLFSRLAVATATELVPGKTLIFIDEVQVAKEIVTAVKFLAQQPSYDYVLSGSLLGVELRDVRSVPVGSLDIVEMFPITFEEFCWANGVGKSSLQQVYAAITARQPVPEFLHDRLIDLYHKYVIVGGMPASVEEFTRTANLQTVRRIQENLIHVNRWDISKYAKRQALVIKDVYDLIPSELNQQNKRFILKDMNQHARFSRYQESFVWLADAGVALPTYNVDDPRYPLKLSRSSNLFKLFMGDVGLLTSTFLKDVTASILAKETDINYGSIYENAVAQELTAAGFDLYYFRNRAVGEIDFLIETTDGRVIPIEVKSGRTYTRHAALDNLLASDYGIPEGYVLSDHNVEVRGNVVYFPVYAAGMLGTPPAIPQ